MSNDNKIAKLWSLIDEKRLHAEYKVNQDMLGLQKLSMSALKQFFIQYRFFTIYYIQDLALLIAKLPFGELRSLLADILSEELGENNPSLAHPMLYDAFLISLGVTQDELEVADPQCLHELKRIQSLLVNSDWPAGVGYRGMGGECLCQIYLSSVFWHFSKNPNIADKKNQIDWRFWDIHCGSHDEEHRELTKQAISNLLRANPHYLPLLQESYSESKASWDTLWQCCFKKAYEEQAKIDKAA